eukprot:TRINITY_DN9059_c0_g2_i3.p2 TRINITY_DN9059_c0_g2~~TRINITY_DN9059_c0_g2_i3.p2  ORF type:complete len:254 (-),score=72.64 TRINITY_DN9059_c0_g2_i3:705-1466(-)
MWYDQATVGMDGSVYLNDGSSFPCLDDLDALDFSSSLAYTFPLTSSYLSEYTNAPPSDITPFNSTTLPYIHPSSSSSSSSSSSRSLPSSGNQPPSSSTSSSSPYYDSIYEPLSSSPIIPSSSSNDGYDNLSTHSSLASSPSPSPSSSLSTPLVPPCPSVAGAADTSKRRMKQNQANKEYRKRKKEKTELLEKELDDVKQQLEDSRKVFFFFIRKYTIEGPHCEPYGVHCAYLPRIRTGINRGTKNNITDQGCP